MFKTYSGRTADDAWQAIATTFRAESATARQHGRGGLTREILHACISIENPVERWVISRNPPINPAFALAEVVWILAGRNDSRFLNFFNRRLPHFAGNGQIYHGAYGWRLRNGLGLDQLDRAFNALRNNPDSRQVVLQIWDSKSDLPSPAGEAVSQDIPCNLISMLKVRSGRLEWTQILRSNDVFLGLPYNFVQFTTLQEVIAGWLELGIGSYNHLSDSLHVYSSQEAPIASSLPFRGAHCNPDSLRLPRYESDNAFLELSRRIDQFILPAITGNQILRDLRSSSLTTPYRNILALLCAEILRRRGSAGLSDEALGECKNSLFVQLFNRWRESKRSLEQEMKARNG